MVKPGDVIEVPDLNARFARGLLKLSNREYSARS